MNKKAGLTMTSIVMYVVIFFVLTILATGVTMAMNSNSLNDKGKIYTQNANIKIKKNIKASLNNSSTAYKIDNKLVFSNSDEYYYDSKTKTVYKNNGILAQNVNNFEFSIKEKLNKMYAINVKYEIAKYNQTKSFEFSYFKGAETSE